MLPTRTLGTSGFQFTTIGIGTWAIGGGDWKFGWGPQDESEAIQAIVRGVEHGVNWIDTAAVYGNGRSEELVAKALAQLDPSQRPYVATKCGRIIQPNGEILARLTPESIRAECESSLRRLELDCIDLYQIHWPDPDDSIELAWQTLVELKEAGKVRAIGVSNHSVDQLKRLQSIHPVASLQPPYNMLSREIEHAILPYCGAQQIGVVCYSPMGKGLLTGAFNRSRIAALPANDHRVRDPRFQDPQLAITLRLLEAIRPVSRRNGRTLAELAIAWVLRRPEVTSAIVGARRPAQLAETLNAANWQLDQEEIDELEGHLTQHHAALLASQAV